MAATLAHIKSRMLLPQTDADEASDEPEEEGDPRAELVRRLLEYQKYKEAAEELGRRPVVGRDVFPRGAAPPIALAGCAPLAEVPIFELIAALDRVMKKAKVTLTHDVVVERISIVDRISAIVDFLDGQPDGPIAFDTSRSDSAALAPEAA
jgi:segregation and condensation protein A